jgi:hypothetical protein
MSDVEYVKGSDLADMVVTWQDSEGTPIDMSTGYTFEVKIGRRGATALITKTTGITGTTTGLTVAWATTAELNTLAAGDHTIQFTATRTSDSKQRKQQRILTILDSVN